MEIVRAATELAGSVDAANTVRRSMRNLQLEPTPRDMLFGKASREELLSQLLTEAENPALASYAAAPRAVAFAPASARTLDLFTRESDEMFLRTPTPSERACVAGDMCEGIALGADGPLVERPSEATLSHQRRGTSNRCMCVVCLRHDGCYRVLNVRRELGYWPHEQSIVRYWSRAGMRGQYRIEDCFLPTTSPRILDLPIVIHIRSYYARETSLERAERLRTAPRDSPASRSDVVFLTQHGYLRPDRTTTLQDFEADFGCGRRSGVQPSPSQSSAFNPISTQPQTPVPISITVPRSGEDTDQHPQPRTRARVRPRAMSRD